jgi:Fic family protein
MAVELAFAKQVALRGMQQESDAVSVQTSPSVAAVVNAAVATAPQPLTEQQELQQLKQMITGWRELDGEVRKLNEQVREKRKRMNAM